MWPEVESAKADNKRELSITGKAFLEKFKKSGLDPTIFTLFHLNFLNISEIALDILPSEIGNLENLQSLILFGNKLSVLPSEVAKLANLKMLDVSRNELKEFPECLNGLTKLVSINLSNNSIEIVPKWTVTTLKSIDFSNNKLIIFPDICYAEMSQLSEVQLHGNKIEEIPENIMHLSSLKFLDVSSNSIKALPKVLASISKLKDINLKENPLSDKRLFKLVEQCRTKQIQDYVKNHGYASKSDSQTVTGNKNQANKSNKTDSIEKDGNVKAHKIKVIRALEDGFKVQYLPEVRQLRPYIFCCIVKNVNLKGDNRLRKFLQAQTKLHDTVCLKREGATIATHDASKIKGNILDYTALPRDKLFIAPLGHSNLITGECLFNRLKLEAENLRKEKKRNVYSGIHKYLYLLEGKEKFPCMMNSAEEVISVPPLTNSDITKMTEDTTELFLEVTSGNSANACRQAMQALIKEILFLGLGDIPSTEDNFHNMLIQQVKVVDPEGNLRNVYPSRTDLIFEEDGIVIERE